MFPSSLVCKVGLYRKFYSVIAARGTGFANAHHCRCPDRPKPWKRASVPRNCGLWCCDDNIIVIGAFDASIVSAHVHVTPFGQYQLTTPSLTTPSFMSSSLYRFPSTIPDANVNARQRHAWTPVHFSTFWGYPEMVKLLLELTDTDAMNNDGETAYQLSLGIGNREIADLLRKP